MPRIETVERTIYSFDELDDSAKERARDWYRRCIDADDINNDTDDRDAIAAILGIEFAARSVPLMNGSTRQEAKVWWSGFSSQGDGASWEGWYSYSKQASKRIREYAPQDSVLHGIADRLQDVQRRNFYRLQCTVTQSGRYTHEYTMQADVTRTDDVYVSESDADDVQDELRDFARWIYSQLESQWEWLNSDECSDCVIDANEYEFDNDGDLIDTGVPQHDDGPAALAMSQDCLAWLDDDTAPDWILV